MKVGSALVIRLDVESQTFYFYSDDCAAFRSEGLLHGVVTT